jgi:hypothetical protein
VVIYKNRVSDYESTTSNRDENIVEKVMKRNKRSYFSLISLRKTQPPGRPLLKVVYIKFSSNLVIPALLLSGLVEIFLVTSLGQFVSHLNCQRLFY